MLFYYIFLKKGIEIEILLCYNLKFHKCYNNVILVP